MRILRENYFLLNGFRLLIEILNWVLEKIERNGKLGCFRFEKICILLNTIDSFHIVRRVKCVYLIDYIEIKIFFLNSGMMEWKIDTVC